MSLVVQLTDPHLRLDGERDDARAAFEAAVAKLAELPRAPDAIVISGDLADTGHPDEYAQVRAALKHLTIPVHVIPGNHDDPDHLRHAFATTETARAGELRLVLCDTQVPGAAGGRLDTQHLRSLLAQDTTTPTIVFMHHPPLFTGMPFLDRIGLAEGDRDRLQAVLRDHPQVARVACGHVHRASFEVLGGCGVLTAPSTYTQAEPAPGSPGIRFVRRGAAIVLHQLRGGEVISHLQPV